MPETLGCAQPKLRWWHDFWASQPTVFRAMRRAPLALGYLVLSCIVGAVFPGADKVLRIPDSIVTLALQMCIVFEAWSDLTGTPRQDHKEDYARLSTAFGSSILYGLAVLVGAVLFLAPGIYVMISASLALVFICIEKMPATSALEMSRKLVRGHFWSSMRYLVVAPLLMTLGMFASFFGIGFAEALAFGEGSAVAGVIDITLTGVVTIITTWIMLSVVPLQVRMFHALKIAKGELANPSPHAGLAM